MLCKLSLIQKHHEQIWHSHKNGQDQARVIIWKQPKAMGIQPLGSSSGSILKILLFPSFCTSYRKIPFCLIILYDILFYFIHIYIYIYIYIYKASRQKETTLGDNFFDASSKVLSLWSLVACFKSSALWLYAHFFHNFIHVHSPWAGTDNPLGPKVWCQQEGFITMVICCNFKKNLFNLWPYTHLFMI